jgi:hypothetical protein
MDTLQGFRISELLIEDFMGVESCRLTVGPNGLLATGDVASGKTTIAVRALEALLVGLGVSRDRIRMGADKCTLFARTDSLQIQQVIRRSGNNEFSVYEKGLDGSLNKWQRPRERIAALIGTLVNPMRIYQAGKDGQREKLRELILASCPAAVTSDDAKEWTGQALEVPEGAHGFDVVRLWHDRFYDERAKAKVEAKKAETAFKLADAEAKRLAALDTVPGVEVPLPGEEDKPIRAAERAREALAQRVQSAEAMAKRTEGTRARIAEILREADAIRDAGPMVPPLSEVERAKEDHATAEADVKDLERRLELARGVLRTAKALVDSLAKKQADANEATRREAQKRQQARDLEVTLAEASIEAPSADELTAADKAIEDAKASAALVRAARAAHDATVDAADKGDTLDAAQAEVARLEGVVKALANTAPAKLAERAHMPDGLVIDGDRISLDGVSVDDLSGAEMRHFSVKLAKRISRLPFFSVDGLESLGSHVGEFLAEAVEGGFQLFGTQVTDGELKILQIEPDGALRESTPAPSVSVPKRVKVIVEGEGGSGV